jgi:DNA-binding transcriptional ArsR family regulator
MIFKYLNECKEEDEMIDPYKVQADLIKAMAHPTRLHILDILARDEACVCHLTTILRQRQPYVSQHLMVLREAGLVQDRKDGVMVYYRLVDKQIPGWISATRDMLRATGVELDIPEVPVGPLADCPCPRCEGAGSCAR